MVNLNRLQYFFIEESEECPYLDNKASQILMVDPTATIDQLTFSALTHHGFRRSGEGIYKSYCAECIQCLACRVPVQAFSMNSIQKKAWKRNKDLKINIISAQEATDLHAQLYVKYIYFRHADKMNVAPSIQQFYEYLVVSKIDNFFIEFWLDQQLVAVSACDRLTDGLSSVYTFYDPDYHRRSLGVASILAQIEYTKSLQLDYIYLGYWIPQSPKMNYKAQYQPLEILYQGQWEQLSYPLNQNHIDQFVDMLEHAHTSQFIAAKKLPLFRCYQPN